MKLGDRTISRPTNKRIGKELMKTAKTELAIALVIGMATLNLAGCGKPDSPPTVTAAAPATLKPAENGEAGHGEGETLKLSAEAIEAAGIKVEELAAQEISEQLIVTATIRPNQDRIARRPRVPGRIVKVERISAIRSRPGRRWPCSTVWKSVKRTRPTFRQRHSWR
jgi:cobalt-zinc-cadmium efflux system membrane fusion protein